MSEEFVRVAAVQQLKPGHILRVQRAGEGVLLANVDGHIYAVSDLCPHEDAPMHLGWLEGCHLHCPLHGSFFDVRTGAVLADPAEEPLATYPVRVEGADVLVGPRVV